MPGTRRLPSWLKMQRASGESYTMVKRLVEDNGLHTICTSGNCPNIGECWNAGTATLMILGDICTRSCKFCGTASGKPGPPDRDEPDRVASAVSVMGLKHCVITSVDRDDLPDGGAGQWADTIRKIKEKNPGVTVEALIPDFRGDLSAVDTVINAGADVISHNIETVRRLTPLIRSVAKYDISLKIIGHIASKGTPAKSGIMLGLGEAEAEVIEAMQDLREAGCSIVTIGQYLAPSLSHMPVAEYVTPEKFGEYQVKGLEMGFKFVESSPLVRSSFHAEKHAGMESGAQGTGHRAHNKVIYDDLGIRDYKETWEYQENFFNAKVREKGIRENRDERTPDRLIFVEHNHVYTLGKSGSEQNLLLDYIQLKAKDAAYYHIDRGGDITYHGPGQLVGYPIFDLELMNVRLKEYIFLLEESVIRCIARYGITGERLEGATGVWIEPAQAQQARKICAIGVRASRYITMHGFALNVSTDLSYFNHINPCGFTDKGVTSIYRETGNTVKMGDIKEDMRNAMREVFGYEYY
ncbi:MAG TPA: lipoyl synthase [Bacteroidales bacterium]|nr:lipoyl synthase [Bacteroidales bacterium]